jgi:hypothetical protein
VPHSEICFLSPYMHPTQPPMLPHPTLPQTQPPTHPHAQMRLPATDPRDSTSQRCATNAPRTSHLQSYHSLNTDRSSVSWDALVSFHVTFTSPKFLFSNFQTRTLSSKAKTPMTTPTTKWIMDFKQVLLYMYNRFLSFLFVI